MLSPAQFGPEFDPEHTSDKWLNVQNIRSKYDDVDRSQRDPVTGKVRALKPLGPWRYRVKQGEN